MANAFMKPFYCDGPNMKGNVVIYDKCLLYYPATRGFFKGLSWGTFVSSQEQQL